MITNTEIIIVFAFLAAGIWLYVWIAKQDVRPWSLKTFFQGGGNLGSDLTENNTVGMTFAWAGGTWFFAWVAYQFGPWIIVSQMFWCTSIIAVALLLPKIIVRVKGRTIHGFLGEYYGFGTQRVAAVATTIGYIINGGYEAFWASFLFAAVLGHTDLAFPLAIGVAMVVGTYCTIGGYKSNATVDKPHNILGVIALAALVLMVTYELKIGGIFWAAAVIFGIGSALYVLLSLITYTGNAISSRLLTAIAAMFALSSLVIVFVLFSVPAAHHGVTSGLIANRPVPLYLIVGTVSYQIFFNLTDMQIWQQIAANEEEPPSKYSAIAWSMVRASSYLLWFPALGGVLLGCALRAVHLMQFTDQSVFTSAFGLVAPSASSITRGIMLGFLLLGFISTSMSTIDSLVISGLQTTWYDLINPKRIHKLLESGGDEKKERRIIGVARPFLIPLSLLMVLIFYGLYRLFPGALILFQPIMYAIPLSLLAPMLYALFRPRSARALATFVFWGIVGAITSVVVMFIITVLPNAPVWIQNWLPSLAPVIANGLSIVFLGVGWGISKIWPARYSGELKGG